VRVVCDRCEKPVERHKTSDMTIKARSVYLPNGIIEWEAVLCQQCVRAVEEFVNAGVAAREDGES
jgi:hypothetical protein